MVPLHSVLVFCLLPLFSCNNATGKVTETADTAETSEKNEKTEKTEKNETNDIEETEMGITSSTLRVKKVDGLSDDFIFGMDASCVPSLEAGGVKYYDYDGNEKDVYKILAENGLNYIRVRIWNDQFDKN